jgi:predicted nuclease with TOPRIM domain
MVEREEEVQKLSSSSKNLKQERKKLEGNFTSLEETVSDLKQENESLEKVNCWKILLDFITFLRCQCIALHYIIHYVAVICV